MYIKRQNANLFYVWVHLEIGGVQQGWCGRLKRISIIWYLCTKMGRLEMGCGRRVTVTIELNGLWP